ncbi:hypothetical protein HSHS1_03500 [Helicobacter suis HS1]|nr:hypothetical protein HSHS1_03500 [Helicobacter suis HS1]
MGAGKTLVAIASCMEQKRMGLVNKSLIAVPNHLTKQWAQEFYRAYPNANVLVVESEDFSPKQREQLYNQIANNAYDAVIIAHSQLEFLANPEQTITDMWAEEEQALRDGNEYLRKLVRDGLLDKSAVMSVRAEEQAIKHIGVRYSKLLAENKSHIDISQMGIDNLIVDDRGGKPINILALICRVWQDWATNKALNAPPISLSRPNTCITEGLRSCF